MCSSSYSAYALATLAHNLSPNKYPLPSPPLQQQVSNNSAPLFVTYHYNGSLRGCIGTFSPQSLPEGIANYALVAALEDSRFPPITIKELPHLTCTVTILAHFEDITLNPMDWVVGTHGIHLVFSYNGRNHSSTFLPEVAQEQKWDQGDTLNHLVEKAGVNAEFTDVVAIKVERYQGIKDSSASTDVFSN